MSESSAMETMLLIVLLIALLGAAAFAGLFGLVYLAGRTARRG